MTALSDPAPLCKAITADGSAIGPTLTDEYGNRFPIRGVKCTVTGAATWIDAAGQEVVDYFVAGSEYAIRPVALKTGAAATLLAMYG